jgi:tetratricopeptide (TPR) repeat protein
LTIYEELGDHHTLPNAHLLLAEILLHLGRMAESQVHIEKALVLVQRSGDAFYHGWALSIAGAASIFLQEYAQAEKQFQESMELYVRSGQSSRSHSECWTNLAIVAIWRNDLPQARDCLCNALRPLKRGCYPPSLLFALEATAFYLSRQAALIEAAEVDALIGRYAFLKPSIWVDVVMRDPVHLASASLPPAIVASAQARGRAFDLWTTAVGLLEQLTTA